MDESLILEAKAANAFAAKVQIIDEFDSEALDGITYDTKTKSLEVRFTNGALYAYSGVPRYTVTMLRNSKSQGRFFQKYIRERYDFAKLEGGAKDYSGPHGSEPGSPDWGGSGPRKDGPSRPPGVRMGRHIFRAADKATLNGFLQERQKEEALRNFLKLTDGTMKIIDEEAVRQNIADPTINGHLSRRGFIDQVLEGFQQTLKEPLPYIDDADDISDAERELAQTFAENIAYAHAARVYDRIKAGTSTDLVQKGEPCADCGKPAVGFLADAFLCEKCMDKATYPIKWSFA